VRRMTPMDEAWILLKRQTTLGEFHPDLPSPHGPVMYYHGTGQRYIPTIQSTGLKPSFGNYGNAVYATSDIDLARYYANKHKFGIGTQTVNRPRSPPSIVGIRAPKDNSVPVDIVDSTNIAMFPQTIPPQYLVTEGISPYKEE